MENEINGKYVVITSKFNCQDFPLNEKTIFVSFEDLKAIDNGIKCFDVENNCVVDYDNTKDLERQHLQELRTKREPLLKAFDTYKTNIVYGLVEETEEERNDIVAWYKRLLDLDEAAIENLPSKISYYL